MCLQDRLVLWGLCTKNHDQINWAASFDKMFVRSHHVYPHVGGAFFLALQAYPHALSDQPTGAAQTSSALAKPDAFLADDDDAEEILLVDEIDVFSGSNFYGKTHNQVAVLECPEVEELLREIWNKRDMALHTPELLQHVMQCAAFRALMQKFPQLADIVKRETSQMCVDLKDHFETGNDYIFDGHRVGYKEMDGVVFNVVKGYKTAFAYLQEASKQRLQDETLLKKALALRIPCGRFSYAKLGSPKILGVSGTIEALGSYEWQVLQRFGIRNYTLVPSVYGRNNFAFLNQANGVPITISQDHEHFFDITTQASSESSLRKNCWR